MRLGRTDRRHRTSLSHPKQWHVQVNRVAKVNLRLGKIAKVEYSVTTHDPSKLLVRLSDGACVPLQSAVRITLDDGSMYGDTLLVLYPCGQVEFLCSWLNGLPPDIERLAELQWFGTE
jgi:hypothetical protein